MLLFLKQIEKARERSRGIDLRGLAMYARDKVPQQLSTASQMSDRAEFLRQSLGDFEKSEISYERIISGSEIQDVNYLARGARAAKAVARVVVRDTAGRLQAYGTGFLIAPQVLITNHHVLPSTVACVRSQAQFDYELDIDGSSLNAVTYELNAKDLFYTSEELDFTVVAVTANASSGEGSLDHYGYLPLVGAIGKVSDGEWLTIIQHPNGDRKQVCVRENKLLNRTDDVLWYSTDTLGGSSGSPAFNNDWYVVALHHSGVPEEKNGQIQTNTGRDYDPSRDGEQDIKWIANEGIRVSRIVEALRSVLSGHAMLQSVFEATPANSRLMVPSVEALKAYATPARTAAQSRDPTTGFQETEMSNNPATPRTVNVTLSIDAFGSVSVVRTTPYAEALATSEAKAAAKKVPAFDVPFDSTYSDRKGFQSKFLDAADAEVSVHLPKLSVALSRQTAKLLSDSTADVLTYHGYSLVMHKTRRFALYSAANVDFSGRYELARPTDVWRLDPRIDADVQVSNFYYASNQFDRGHLTRREDMEYGGTRLKALESAADTCHWTNCTPQHAHFNQNKELWQGIERYIFEDGVKLDKFRAQVFTGPILEESDPVWDKFPKIQYPVRFWKVVAAVTSEGKLFATAYILDQSDVIGQYGIEAAREVPFGAYKTFQVPIQDVEELTQLAFFGGPDAKPFPLRSVDPLPKAPRRARRPGLATRESLDLSTPGAWIALDSLESMVLPA